MPNDDVSVTEDEPDGAVLGVIPSAVAAVLPAFEAKSTNTIRITAAATENSVRLILKVRLIDAERSVEEPPCGLGLETCGFPTQLPYTYLPICRVAT